MKEKQSFLLILIGALLVIVVLGGVYFWPDDSVPNIDLESVKRRDRVDGGAELWTHVKSAGWVEIPKTEADPDPTGNGNPGFLGAQACAKCHQDKYESFQQTAHYRTSDEPNSKTILGNFEGDKKRLDTDDEKLFFEMTQSDEGFFQNLYFHDLEKKFRFDLVTGSGKMGQTYLFWDNQRLYQHHVSYFTETDKWINSPGYENGTACYSRAVGVKCLSCHATYFEELGEVKNRLNRNNYILHISCERCHGPGKEHVDFHQANPDEKTAQKIVNPRDLDRDRMNDVCSRCHSGMLQPKQPIFSFRPGDNLGDFFDLEKKGEVVGGVHTDNQLARLKESQCFNSSELTCADCHNPHQQERDNLALFSKRCINCHEVQECGMREKSQPHHSENCIDCHMPKRRDKETEMETSVGSVFPLLRDHHIRIDQKETDRILKKWFDEQK